MLWSGLACASAVFWSFAQCVFSEPEDFPRWLCAPPTRFFWLIVCVFGIIRAQSAYHGHHRWLVSIVTLWLLPSAIGVVLHAHLRNPETADDDAPGDVERRDG